MLQKCRELLGPSAELSNSELSELVNSLYVFAETAVRLHADQRCRSDERPLPPDDQAEVDERAAIRESTANGVARSLPTTRRAPELAPQATQRGVYLRKGD